MKTRIPRDAVAKGKAGPTTSFDCYEEILGQLPEDTPLADIASSIMLIYEDGGLGKGEEKAKDGKEKSDTEGQARRSITGRLLEYAIMESLHRANIGPLYFQTMLLHNPLAKFDFLLYHPKQPVAIAAKYSLRERWKQAALEGEALKDIYRDARNYLIVGGEKELGKEVSEARKRALKQRQGEGRLMRLRIEDRLTIGIDNCIAIDSPEWGELLHDLATRDPKFVEAKPLNPIVQGGKPVFPLGSA